MISSRGTSGQVSVQLSGCSKDDAQTVLRVLCGTFESDRQSPKLRDGSEHGHHTVWSSVFDVGHASGEHPQPAPLHEKVDAELQGSTQAVGMLRKALSDAFEVRQSDAVAGDQEQEMWLELQNK